MPPVMRPLQKLNDFLAHCVVLSHLAFGFVSQFTHLMPTRLHKLLFCDSVGHSGLFDASFKWGSMGLLLFCLHKGAQITNFVTKDEKWNFSRLFVSPGQLIIESTSPKFVWINKLAGKVKITFDSTYGFRNESFRITSPFCKRFIVLVFVISSSFLDTNAIICRICFIIRYFPHRLFVLYPFLY